METPHQVAGYPIIQFILAGGPARVLSSSLFVFLLRTAYGMDRLVLLVPDSGPGLDRIDRRYEMDSRRINVIKSWVTGHDLRG